MEHLKCALLGQTQVSPAYIWLGWKVLPGTNTSLLLKSVNHGQKSFIRLTPGWSGWTGFRIPWSGGLGLRQRKRAYPPRVNRVRPATVVVSRLVLGPWEVAWLNLFLPVFFYRSILKTKSQTKKSTVARLLNKRLMLSSSFRCDQIYDSHCYGSGHTYLCIFMSNLYV
jgi:hypothetical protein